MKQKVSMFDKRRGREIILGTLDGEVFIKMVDTKKHFMGKHKGYGIQIEAFTKLKEVGAKKILIIDQSGNKLESSIETWDESGVRANEGFGLQIFLAVSKMNKVI